MSETRNHHYVPQGYLRGFAVYPPAYPKKAKLLTIDLTQGRSFTVSVRNIAAIRDFNRIDAEGHDPNALENAYAGFESMAASAIKRVAKSGAFEGDDKILVLNLIALMATRNPRLRKNWSDFTNRLYRIVLETSFATEDRYNKLRKRMEAEMPHAKPLAQLPYEDFREFIKSDRYEFETHQNTLIRLELDVFESVLKTLIARKWVLQIANDQAGDFVTSDHPVVLTSLRQSHPGVGHGLKETMLLFPLTRKCALMGTFEGDEGVIQAPTTLVALANSAVIARATAQVYAYNDSFRYVKRDQMCAGKDLHCDPDCRLRSIDEDEGEK
ncbi:DUF4238 domain-containing protein [Rhizobium ruizarguesonis]|uniref:DUF4238 domain-containing protein n=1 Tax=Rhizobium ruizarguesonis TaxID=2081791 RepID=UPI0013BD3FB9|nr:DUF4238 domain-containing protein [Rhizobium ruizarguesonis]NEH32109.1 DUF4238 domain-containing protein [Rhizobium ruizarguesonis]NEJ10393.1 DUF4238 domain-containing protein [Rhizobium ruizarguesonis]NEK12246.1 DUF4238 domain-containing protein [Rhizobium ruizarguesonis]QIJ39467.1 DUF4238 domain-containing protein [Rhizobium leguminosarum]